MTGMREIFFLFIVVLQHNWCMALKCPTLSVADTLEKLSGKLLSTCSDIEDEKNPIKEKNETRDELEFAKSTYYLYQLGQRYSQNAREGSEIEQKHDYIRAAALFYGAKVRYDTFLAVLLAPTTENNDDLQSCVSEMEKAYFKQVENYGKETIEESIQRRNPISKCITMIQLQGSLLLTKDSFLSLLEERERTYPERIDNVGDVLTEMNLTMPPGRNVEAVRSLSRNLTCLRKDINSMLNHSLSTLSGDLSGILDVTIDKDQAEKVQEASKKIKLDLRSKRAEGEQKLEQELQQKRSTMINDNYIESVNKILRQNTEKYNQLFKRISEECIKIIGKPPTKYAVMSFGSTSREEVTLYSDFEHAILYRPTTEITKKQVQEYYLWYTVLFQITVISLEETMVHAVKLRPPLEDYYDSFTPRGIAFDRMVEGGNKNPFGDGDKYHLILNVDNTKLYLGPEQTKQDIRNLLARSRFAFGDNTVYDEFVQTAKDVMQNKETSEIIQDQIDIIKTRTTKKIISGEDHSNLAKRYEDPKNSLYRPLTVLLELLARIYRYSNGSTDGFIQWLEFEYAKQRWGKETFLTLRYDLALASEVRLKVYSAYGRQMYEVSKEEIFDVINKTEYVRMFTEIVLLRNTLLDLNERCSQISLDSSEFPNPMPSFRATELAIMKTLSEQLKLVGKLRAEEQEELTRVKRFAESMKKENIDDEAYIKWKDNKRNILEIFAKLLSEIYDDWGREFDMEVREYLAPTEQRECSTTSSILAIAIGGGTGGGVLLLIIIIIICKNQD